MTFQRPLKRKPIGHPIDLPERMLDDLSRLFLRESEAVGRAAVRAYTRGEWDRGAHLEIAAEGLAFDSKEIAYLAVLKHRDRVEHVRRNLMPWERLREERRAPKRSPYDE